MPDVDASAGSRSGTARRKGGLPSAGASKATRPGDAQASNRPKIQDFGLVFSGERGQPLRGATVYRRFHRLLKSNGLPIIRFHDLRHSSASIMLALGLSLFTVQKTLGQASLQMLSRRYGHIVPELAAAELEKLEDAFVNFEQGSAWRLQAQLPTRDHLTPTYSWCATA